MYIGLIPPFNSNDYITTFVALQTGVQNGSGDVQPNAGWDNSLITGGSNWGQISIVDGVYTNLANLGNRYNTAVVTNKDMKDGDFIVLQYTGGAAQAGFTLFMGTTTQETYESITNNQNWALKWNRITRDENVVFGGLANTNLKYGIGVAGGGAGSETNFTVLQVPAFPQFTKIYLSASKVSTTEINVAGTWVLPDGTIVYSINFPITVTDADEWFINSSNPKLNRRFYATVQQAAHTIKLLYEDKLPTVDYSSFSHPAIAQNPFITPFLSTKITLSLTKPESSSIATIDKNKGGKNYKIAPTIQITGGGGTGARTEAILAEDVITQINILLDDPTNPPGGSGGTGFTSIPTINIITATGDTGYGATAVATTGGGRITKITLTENVIYSTSSSEYNTSCVIDSDIISGNYAVFRYVGYPTQNLNVFVGAVDKSTYPNDLTLNNSFTDKEGFLIRVNPELPSEEPSQLQLLADIASWWSTISYQFGGTADATLGVYSNISGMYNTAALIKEYFSFTGEAGVQYKGDTSVFPSVYLGMIDRLKFIEELIISPLTLTTKMVWNTPLPYTFGNTNHNKGVYSPLQSQYNTAAAINNDSGDLVDQKFNYIGIATKHLKGYYGFVKKSAYEELPRSFASYAEQSLILARKEWILPLLNPLVVIAGPGTGATATAVVSEQGVITSIHVTSMGQDYDDTTTITITGDGTDATASAFIRHGRLMGVNVLTGGNNYTSPPAYTFLSASDRGSVYKTNTVRYNTASIINADIRKAPAKIQYSTKTNKHLSAYVGYVSKNAYETLNSVEDSHNWASDPRMTLNQGILIRMIQPPDSGNFMNIAMQSPASAGWVISTAQAYVEGVAVYTDGTYSTTTTHYDTAAIIDLNTLTHKIEIVYTGAATKTLSAWFGYVIKDNYEAMTSTDTIEWAKHGVLAHSPGGRPGILLRVLSPNDIANPYSPNSAFIYTVDGASDFAYTQVDLGRVIEDTRTNAQIHLSTSDDSVEFISINDLWNNSDYQNQTMAVIDGVYKCSNTFNTAAIIKETLRTWSVFEYILEKDTQKSIEDQGLIFDYDLVENQLTSTPYFGIIERSFYEALSGLTDEQLSNWAIQPSITQNGLLVRVLSKDDPVNTLGNGNSALEIIKDGTLQALSDLGGDFGNIKSSDIVRFMISNTLANAVTVTILYYDRDETLLWSNAVLVFTGVNINTWYYNKHLYVTSSITDWLVKTKCKQVSHAFKLIQDTGEALIDATITRIYSTTVTPDINDERAWITTNDPIEQYKTAMSVTTTILEYTVDGVKSYSDVGKSVEQLNELGWMQLQFRTDSTVFPQTVAVNFSLHQENGDVLINDIKTIEVADSTAWYGDKRAYITIKNKGDRYVSNPVLTDPSNWAISGAITFDEGFLFHHVSPDDPSNPYAPNSAIRTITRGVIDTIDFQSALAQINQNGLVNVIYSAVDSTTTRINVKITQSDTTVLYNNNFDIIVNDSAQWIRDYVGYISTNDSSEVYTSTAGTSVDDRVAWSDNLDISKGNGVLFRILAPNESPNTDLVQAAIQTIVNGVSSSIDVFSSSTELLKTNSTIYIALTKQTIGAGNLAVTVTLNVRQDDFTLLATKSHQFTGLADADAQESWLKNHQFYITSNNPEESYISKGTACGTVYFNTNEMSNYATTIPNIQPSNQDSLIVVSADIDDGTHIKVNLTYLDAAKASLAATQYVFEVANSATWFKDKRFYISTDSSTEKYTVEDYYPYTLAGSQTVDGPTMPIDSNFPNPQHLDSFLNIPFDSSTYNPNTLALNNWTNSISLTKRDGFLIHLDFATGGAGAGTSSVQGGAFAQMDAASVPVPLVANTKLNKYDYIQIAVNQNSDAIKYEIAVVDASSATARCIYREEMTVATGTGGDWLTDVTKRYYITTNNTLHTFRATRDVHAYKGIDVPHSAGFINVGDTGYENYTTDFTSIIAGSSFIVGPIPDPTLKPPLPIPRVTSPQNFIISLTGQDLEVLNGLYQLETLADIKALGIRLTRNTLIMPLCTFDVIVPGRQFKIPMRFRRLLRRITNMTGI